MLQTQTVSLEEVRKDLQAWVEPFKVEVESILKSGAMEVIDDHKYQQLLKEHPDLERLPMLAVATIKPPYKRKGRVVVCGNHSSKQPQQGEPDPSVGGVDTVAIRCILALAVQRQLQVGSIDVKGAFLQAPRRSVALRPTVCDPPAILKQMQLVGKSEKWLVHKALYGFVESPSDWSFHRDTTMRQLRWTSNGCSMRFQQTAEKHVWRVVQEGQEGSDHGYVAVYVDDLLFAVTKEHLTGVVTALKGAWQCSEPEFVTQDRAMRFCGFELQWVQGEGLRLSQEGFITEMLKRRNVHGESKFPLNPISDEPDENPISIEDVRRAQGVVGELTWLTTRSRPDLAFSVGAASRLIHRRPQYVLEMCDQILKYVHTTKSLALTYRRCEPGDMGDQQELQVSKSMDSLQIFSDASYGPVHERCKSISGAVVSYAGCVVAWDSQAQPFVSQSTAEAEVISYNSASQMAESVSAFLEAVGYITTKQLYGDSKAGIAVISNECGPWRTRHLRIRASKLRELVQTPEGCWTIRHMPGSLLVADGCTKPLTHQAFEMFQQRLGLEALVEKKDVEMKRCFLQSQGVKKLDKGYGALLAVACGLLFWHGQVRAGSGLLAALTGLELWRKKSETGSAEELHHGRPRVCALRGPPKEEEHPEALLRRDRGGARVRGRDAVEQVTAGMARVKVTVEVEVNEKGGSNSSTLSDVPVERAPGRHHSADGIYPVQSEGAAMCQLDRFVHRPRGADRWEMLEAQGWLLRIHGRGRVRPFHPLHRSCPCNGGSLTGERWTILFNEAGEREVIQDDWNYARTWQKPGQWFGYTLLRMKAASGAQSVQENQCADERRFEQVSQSVPVQRQEARSSHESTFDGVQRSQQTQGSSDEGFEFVREDSW